MGRSPVGWKGTLVFLPHSAQTASNIWRFSIYSRGLPELRFPELRRTDLQAGQRPGSFVNPFSAKKACSDPVKGNSALQSRQVRVLSLYMMMDLLLYFPTGTILSCCCWFCIIYRAMEKTGRNTCNKQDGIH
jgi:hypothetical protein